MSTQENSGLINNVSVLIDARKIHHGGIGVYLKNLLCGLVSFENLKIGALVFEEDLSYVMSLGEINCIVIKTKLYSYDELFNLKKYVDFNQFDLFHTPHFILPYGIPIPTIVTIHDTIHLTHPQKWYYPLLIKPVIKSALKRATQVLTVSEASKRALNSLVKKANVKVIPNSVDPIFLLSDMVEDSQESIERENYCLAVFSNTKFHKKYDDLISAFKTLKSSDFLKDKSEIFVKKVESLKLVLVGQGLKETKSDNLPDFVEIKGAVSSKELKNLYQRAQCLVVSSIAEGFCLPVIEAQSCGTPVICRPVAAILELMTTNDLVAKDFSLVEFTKAISDFISRRTEKIENIDYGVPLAHMQRFDRKIISYQLSNLYCNLVNLNRLKLKTLT